MTVHALRNPIQEYDWGSRTALPAFLGRPVPSPRPWAELWLGAHPRASSKVRAGGGWLSLREAIAAEPRYWLGDSLAAAGELPFLFKVLAVERPLSLQLHPDRSQAEAGFARENAAGIALDAPERLYRDANAKHEMVCALTPFRALCGLRPLPRQCELLAALALPALDALAPAAGTTSASAWLEALLRLPEAGASALAAAAAKAAARRAGEDPAFALAAELADAHPGDVAALAPLLLEALELDPGDGLFLRPGELHCHLGGTALELMESSDNVVRGGLTSKRVDVEELLTLAAGRPHAPERLRALEETDGERTWPVCCPAFALSRIRVGRDAPRERDGAGRPEILLCTGGEVRIEGGGSEVALRRGAAAFVAASTPRYRISGEAELYRVRVPA